MSETYRAIMQNKCGYEIECSCGLKNILFFRYLRVPRCLFSPAETTYTFRDERGKLTAARYRVKYIHDNTMIYRLDARSIRYMARRQIIENDKEGR